MTHKPQSLTAGSIKGRIMLLYIQRLGTGNLYQVTEPLGLKALAAFVEEEGYLAKVFSGSVHEAAARVEAELAGGGLDALGLYCDYENRSAVESFSRKAKEDWGLLVLVGGPQAVALGKGFLKSSGCDALVLREGEYALFSLLEYFLNNRGSLAGIAGISFLDEGGSLQATAPGPPIPDLDALPIRAPGRDAACRANQETLSLLTGRGCPFKCAFCYEGSVPGKVRLRSVGHVMDEIRQSLEQNPGLKFLWFADDTFTLNPGRVEEFSRELAGLRREHDFVWFCECHPNTLMRWPQILPMMLGSGLVRMQIGIETGSGRVMKLYKKQTTLRQIEQVVELCMQQGLPQLVGNIIIGGAAESRQAFADTKQFAARLMRLGPGMLEITSTFFMPFPGTAITQDPGAFGLKLIDPGSLTSKNDVAVTEAAELSREKITAMRLEFARHVHETMSGLFHKGCVPEERILQDYRLHLAYGMESGWYQHIYSADPAVDRYYTLKAEGRAIDPSGQPARRLWRAFPKRTLNLWESLRVKDQAAFVSGMEISDFEMRLLLLCDGRRSYEQVRGQAPAKAGAERAQNSRAFEQAMNGLEKRRWLAHCLEPDGQNKPVARPDGRPGSGPGSSGTEEPAALVERALRRSPGQKSFHLPGKGFLLDRKKALARAEAIERLGGGGGFVWSCRAGAPELIRAAPWLGRLAQCGLARVFLPIPFEPAGHDSWGAAERAFLACMGAGVPLVTGGAVFPGFPQTRGELEGMLGQASRLLEAAPGRFEWEMSPFLKTGEFDQEAIPLSAYEAVWESLPDVEPRDAFSLCGEFTDHVKSAMRAMLERGSIDHHTLLWHFSQRAEYGLESVWMREAFLGDIKVLNYYLMMSRGAVSRLEDVDPARRGHWRPQRTIDLWGLADFSGGYPQIGGMALSPLEYELLLFCTGKQTLRRILRTVHEKFQDRFDGFEDFQDAAMNILGQFENRLWLAYAEL